MAAAILTTVFVKKLVNVRLGHKQTFCDAESHVRFTPLEQTLDSSVPMGMIAI